ncbi:MAG: glycoside hydrolase family 9 protein [Ruminococcus sp.]|nr:glycoside hydrolase family 9 protein [Ruminococcus sp.]
MYNVSVKHIVGKKSERSVKDMNKRMNKVKSAILSGMIAVGSVAGSFAAVAPSLNASAVSNDNYAKLLQYSLYFYDANMCGKNVGERSALTWRDDCHTSDEVDGGFHDAGDHVKFGLPAGYAASVLGLSYQQFGDAFDSTGQTAHLKMITDHFAEFFKNSTTLSGGSVTNFVYQVGDGDADHAEWCAPEVQGPSSRKTFSTNSGASDIAAEYAAALAANYVNFGNAEDLTYAKALFDFSTKYNQKATDGVNGFYSSWDYYDDQAWAAGWLYLATKDNSYKSFLDTYMNTSDAGASGMDGAKWGIYSTLRWNNVSMGAALLQGIINGSSSDAWGKVTTYINDKGGSSDKWFWQEKWGSARYNTAQQFAALVASKNGAKDYYSWAAGQMDYILGNNPFNTNLVVGMESNSSKYPHHRAASGYANYDEMGNNDGYSSKGHVLVGALVGGPEAEGVYHDTVQDYYCNEVTLDYNATLVAAAAGLYSKYKTGSTVDPSSIPGVDGSSVTPIETTPQPQETTTIKSDETPVQTTTTTKADTTPTQTTVPQQSSSGTDKEATLSGSNGEYTFNPENADNIEIKLTMNSNDTEGNGAIGFSDAAGNWTQVEFKLSVSGGKATATVSGEKLKGVTNAKLMIWWPTSATIDSVTLKYNNSTPQQDVTTAAPVITPVVTTTTTTQQDNDPKTDNILYGDANLDGKVTISDAVAILQYMANSSKYNLNDQAKKNADVDGNPGVTGSDADVIQKVDAGVYTVSQLPL